jgi:3-hydroxyisobutyrate dehydrogenase-like beta-hydroxyacid dehydrogenase
MNIAFIGMGIMGKPMAINLKKAGHTVYVHGRRPESMTPSLEAGCAGCASIAEAAAQADIIIVMVSDTPMSNRSCSTKRASSMAPAPARWWST